MHPADTALTIARVELQRRLMPERVERSEEVAVRRVAVRCEERWEGVGVVVASLDERPAAVHGAAARRTPPRRVLRDVLYCRHARPVVLSLGYCEIERRLGR